MRACVRVGAQTPTILVPSSHRLAWKLSSGSTGVAMVVDVDAPPPEVDAAAAAAAAAACAAATAAVTLDGCRARRCSRVSASSCRRSRDTSASACRPDADVDGQMDSNCTGLTMHSTRHKAPDGGRHASHTTNWSTTQARMQDSVCTWPHQ